MYDGEDGADGYTIALTNETHTIQCDFLGNPIAGEIGFPNSKASSSIIVLKGQQPMQSVGESSTVTPGTFKYTIEPKTSDSTCLGLRASNDKFYIKELYADSGSLLINITLDNKQIIKKVFTWSKTIHGENAKYVMLKGENTFKYHYGQNAISGKPTTGEMIVGDMDKDLIPTPETITIKAYVYNIKSFTLTWKYLNSSGVYEQIISSSGSVILNNELTVDDKKLFNNSKICKIKIICTDTDTKKVYEDDFTINKQYDGEDQEVPENAKHITINGLSAFHYDNKEDTTPTPTYIKIEPVFHNIVNYTFEWKYRKDNTSSWITISSKEGCLIENSSLIINDKVCFGTSLYSEFKIIAKDLDNNKYYESTHTVTKVYDGTDGEDAYTCVLSNESDTILFDQNEVIKPGQVGDCYSKSFSTVLVNKGDKKLLPTYNQNYLATGLFSIEFDPKPVNCTVRKHNNDSFYLYGITPGATNGKVSITVYLESSKNKVVKEYTWNKVIDGTDAKFLILEGEDKFVYDDPEDTTSTPETITITAKTNNINNPIYKWKYFNGSMVDIPNVSGVTISGKDLTFNDKALFPNGSKVLKIQCSVFDDKTEYTDTTSIVKIFDGEIGPPGTDSKTVSISGANQIHYNKNNTPTPSSITLTAIPSNYVSPTYKWYYITSSGQQLISNQTSNKLVVNHNSNYFSNDIALIKVECLDGNKTDLSFYEHSISKTYDGEDAPTLVLNISEGTRNICYNGKGTLVTTIIESFRLEIYEDDKNVTSTSDVRSISWSAKGHFSHSGAATGSITFKPNPLNIYDESKLDTSVSVVVNYKGRIIKQSAPVTVSKNSTALDWIEEWDGSKVDIGGTHIITPKLFAGKKDTQKNTITGVALGQDIIDKNDAIGLAIYYDNKLLGRINADPTRDNGNLISFGDPAQGRMVVKTDGSMTIESGAVIGEMDKIYSDIADAEKNAISSANGNTQNALKDYVPGSVHDKFVESTSDKFITVDKNIIDSANSVKDELHGELDGVKSEQAEFKRYVRFIDGTIVLGDNNSTLQLRLTNDRIQFLQSGREVAYINNNKLYITDAQVTNSIIIGNFAWKPRSNGNLSFTLNG